ncbi:DUF3253 domain-containing protein [Salsipaludibacter albus]|uniref:DUF3253 domain-containing protein n=1 Tax=Salsipaludibacter albus TaxID=2849650 RepID=UPI001EE4AF74|nr:DUF3253 domain-containing protein [Salsipaludibacter albus]MBY5162505.1 DUF3253 domain-containing protein [Salsipaludibacter albus]
MNDDGPERTPDGHHVVIDGRRWRATDPDLPEALRSALVGELMAARRAVGAADTDVAVRRARDRVQDAKVALGERGHPWWEEADDDQRRERVAATLRALARRADGGPVGLSTAAQVLPDGRDGHEPPGPVHDVAADLVAGGDVVWVDEARDAVTLRN